MKGTVTKQTALALAVVQVPLAALATLHLLGFQPRTNPWACAVLAGGFALILVYNLWGKAFSLPLLADLIQGLGWGSLVVFGALVANRDHPDFWPRTAPLLAYAVGFILLVSGVHGGLRDLWTDGQNRARTTALFLGASRSWVGADAQPARSTRRLVLYAFAVHTSMFLLAFAFLWDPPQVPGEPPFFSSRALPFAWIVVAGSFALSSFMLWLVVKPEPIASGRDRVMSWHALVLLLPPLGLYLLSEIPDPVFQIVVASCFVVPLLLQEGILPGLIRFLLRDGHPFVPMGRAGEADPDAEWTRRRNLHDVVYWEGGILGGLIPWRAAKRWEWRYAESNLKIASYMWKRWGERARQGKSLGSRMLARAAQWVLPFLYAVIAMLLGWTTWSLTKREATQPDLDLLEGLGGEGRKGFERWI